MIKKYLGYLKDNPQGYWFKAKWYGWGWVPATWQGWAVLAIFTAILILNGIYLETKLIPGADPSFEDMLMFYGVLLVSVSLLLIICYKLGEKPHWSWGKPAKSAKK